MVKDLLKLLDAPPPDDKETKYRLLKHTLQAPQDLDVSVLLAGLPSAIKVVLTIDLDIEFDALTLVIRSGRLRAIDLRTAQVQSCLRYRNVKLIEPKPSAPLNLPLWPLPGEGLAIG